MLPPMAPQDEPVAEDGPAPHSDPRLAMRGRIVPSTGNPAGYPPYDISKMAGYTNRQIRYYLQTHQIADVPAFAKAKSRRDDILANCGGNGDTDDDLETPDNRTDNNQPTVAREYTLEDDSEPDEEFPSPVPGEKGLKVEKIHILKHGGGFVNHRLWLQSLFSAFRADRNRFFKAENRIIHATAHMDDELCAIWSSDIELMSHLQFHWRKFLRWAEQTHLHGEVDRAAQVQEFNDATQQETEDPNSFYSRLSMLAIGIGRKLTTDDIFPKLLPGIRNVILRNGRESKNVRDLVSTAQQIWGTFGSKTKRKRDTTDRGGSYSKPTQTRNSTTNTYTSTYPQRPNYHSNITRGSRGNYRGNGQGTVNRQRQGHSSNALSEPERMRRLENRLCFNCGLPNHIRENCTKSFNPNPTSIPLPSHTNDPKKALNNTLPTQTAGLRYRNTSSYRRRGFHRNRMTRVQPLTHGNDDTFDAEDGPSAAKYSKN
jgi:hypothetical protein